MGRYYFKDPVQERNVNSDCRARQYSDQMRCERCDLTWDMNDHEPPSCLSGKELFNREAAKIKSDIK